MAAASLPAEAADFDFQLEISGLPGVDFRARCYILDAGVGRSIIIRDQTPAAYHIVGDSAACWVSNIDRGGHFQTALLDAEGMMIASSQSVWSDSAVTLRSGGPWGAAGSFNAPLQFVVFGGMPGTDVVPLPSIIHRPPMINGVPAPRLPNLITPIDSSGVQTSP